MKSWEKLIYMGLMFFGIFIGSLFEQITNPRPQHKIAPQQCVTAYSDGQKLKTWTVGDRWTIYHSGVMSFTEAETGEEINVMGTFIFEKCQESP